MSSFIGHTLTGLGIYATTQQPEKRALRSWAWPVWLLFISIAPDLDYVLPGFYGLPAPGNSGLRVTHSLAGCLLFPLLTIAVLPMLKLKPAVFRLLSLQVFMVGLSHVTLDLLVGVSPLPLFWPLSTQAIRLPFGILPSAPAFFWSNTYLYRNLSMEVGVLGPFFLGVWIAQRSRLTSWLRWSLAVALWLLSAGFMVWAYSLPR